MIIKNWRFYEEMNKDKEMYELSVLNGIRFKWGGCPRGVMV